MDETMGQRIKKVRKAAHYNQPRLAEALDVTVQTIGNWERDKGNISAKHLALIAEEFDTNIIYLYYGNV